MELHHGHKQIYYPKLYKCQFQFLERINSSRVLNELIVFSIASRLPAHPLWSIHLTVVFVSQSVDKIGENNVVESSIKKIFNNFFILFCII